jgi:hypothetical protein
MYLKQAISQSSDSLVSLRTFLGEIGADDSPNKATVKPASMTILPFEIVLMILESIVPIEYAAHIHWI